MYGECSGRNEPAIVARPSDDSLPGKKRGCGGHRSPPMVFLPSAGGGAMPCRAPFTRRFGHVHDHSAFLPSTIAAVDVCRNTVYRDRTFTRHAAVMRSVRAAAAGRPGGCLVALEAGEVLLEILEGLAQAALASLRLRVAQLDAADLAGQRLGQLGDELDPAYPLVRGELPARESEYVLGQRAAGLARGGHGDERLRPGQPQRIGTRDDRPLGDGRVLEQRALELERTDPVIGSLEHVVCAPDEGHVAVRVARRRGRRLRAVLVTAHQAQRMRGEVEADLALVG